jgi:hemin uptake protein HemP
MTENPNNPAPDIKAARNADRSSGDQRVIAMNDNTFDTRDIFIGTREVIIAHGGERYRLRLTAQNKLILTK